MSRAETRAIQLFCDYLDLPAQRRKQAMALLLRNDPETHRVLSAMLKAHDSPHPIDKPLRTMVFDEIRHDAEDTARIGSRLGPWQIDRLIATGGMGVVYEAHRDDGQYQQRVALKCIRANLATPQLVVAFQTERDYLARLEHPHITTLLDGGVDATGSPWFAMRYVEGQAIDHWCDEHALPLRARVWLLLQACDALAYAHGQRILHRDLKPSNLLVTAGGQVQLLDFGLSTAVASGNDTQPLAISVGYTAPEILHHNAAPDIASDIYSLGQIMARLLCGTASVRPLLLRSGADATVDLPQLARDAATGTARMRGLDSEVEFARYLTGDLDAIFTRSTRLDPGQRYRSVSEFSDDLQRWLDGRPVHARNGSWFYRSTRFLDRHRIVASLTALILLSSAIGIGTAYWLQQRTLRQAQATHSVARLFEQTLGTATLSGLSETPFSSATLLQKTEAQVRALDLHGQPEVLAQALSSLARSYATIGDYTHAMALATEASPLHGRGQTPTADTQATLASLLNLQARHAEAQQVAEQALANLPQSDDTRPVRLRLLTEIARSQWERAQQEQARNTVNSALALAHADLPQQPEPYIELLILRGGWLLRIFELKSAARDLDEAIGLAGHDHPYLADAAKELQTRVFVQMEDATHARQLSEEVLASRRRRLGENHPDTGRAWNALAASQCFVNENVACRVSAQKALDILRPVYGEQHPAYAGALRMLAIADYRGGPSRYEPNIARMQWIRTIMHASYPPTHEEAMRADSWLGIWLLQAPPSPSQKAHVEEGIALLQSLFDSARRNRIPFVFGKLALASALIERAHRGDMDKAEALVQETQTDINRYFGPWHSSYLTIGTTRAEIEYASGDLPAADASLASLAPYMAAQMPRINAQRALCDSMKLRAAIAVRQHEPARAREFLLQLQQAAQAKSGLRVLSGCGDQAMQGMKELQRTGRYSWKST